MALNAYITDTQNLLHDPSAQFYSVANVTLWINKARLWVARQSECIRILPASSGGVASYAVTNGGSGYGSPPTVTVSAPNVLGGVQATATATVGGGQVTAVNVSVAGTGYSVAPIVTITGGGGANAAATATLSSFNKTAANTEVYQFSAVNTFVQLTPGVATIFSVKQIAVYWGALKPALAKRPWTILNAYFRANATSVGNYPVVFAQYGQGEAGSIYLWPIPVQALGMDWDCICDPIPLASDATVEAIPEPYQEAISHKAAAFGFKYAQRIDDAKTMDQLADGYLMKARATQDRSIVTNWYGT